MAKVLKNRIVSLERLAPGIFKMTLESEYISKIALPGQFVNVKCSEGINALLRRPVSICDVDRNSGTYDIVFQLKGIGTEYLSKKQTGEEVDIIGPLGKPFHVSRDVKRVAVLGGGIGVFPLLFLLKEYGWAERKAFLGFRSSELIVLRDEFLGAADMLYLSTDDGSFGYKGLITDLLEKDLEENRYDLLFTCGPMPMIKKAAGIAEKNSIKCQVSLEQRMGCGIGACLVCACKTRLGDEWEYSHVCKDGPVFWSGDVILE